MTVTLTFTRDAGFPDACTPAWHHVRFAWQEATAHTLLASTAVDPGGVELMDYTEFATRLAHERGKVRAWSQPTLGRYMAGESARLGRPMTAVPRATISAWENGHRYPDPWYAYVLCNTLALTPDALALESVLTPSAVADIEASIQRQQALESAREVGRMQQGGHGAAALAGPVAAGVADLERLSSVLLGLSRMDAVAAADLRRATDHVLDLQGQIGTRLMLRELHTHLVTLDGVLRAAQAAEIRRELVMMAGETAAAAAQGWYSLLDYGEAKLVCEYARRLAHELGGSNVQAMAYGCEALLYANRLHGQEEGLPGGPRKAVELLRAAEAAAGAGAPPCVRMWLYSVRAWENAATGDEVSAGRDLDAAERALSLMTARPSGFFRPWDASYLLVSRGKSALMLGDLTSSMYFLDLALQAASGWMRPFYEVQLATVCAQAGEPDRAASLLTAIVERALASGTTMLVSRISKVASQELAPYRDLPTIRALHDRLASA